MEDISLCVPLPPDAPRLVRENLGLTADSSLKIAFVAGPGDAMGTFNHWIKGRHDPRTPVIAYSTMFYALVAGIRAEALLLVEQEGQPTSSDPRFKFVTTPRRRGRRGIGFRIDERNFAKEVLRHLRSYSPDVILVGTDAPERLINALPASRRIILTAHNTYWPLGMPPTGLRARLKLWFTSRALQRIDTCVSTSAECAAQVRALGGPAETRSFVEAPQVLAEYFLQTLTPASTARHLLFLGRIEECKGVFDLLSAFNSIAAEFLDLTLDLAGTGSAAGALTTAIAASPFASRICFHGLLSAEDVHGRIAAADLLICPTRSSFAEGLALVVIEAAVHGVPTLLSSIVPAKDLLPGACIEFTVDDTNALTSALRKLVAEPSAYAACAASLMEKREIFQDRTRSWGKQLYRAIVTS